MVEGEAEEGSFLHRLDLAGFLALVKTVNMHSVHEQIHFHINILI